MSKSVGKSMGTSSGTSPFADLQVQDLQVQGLQVLQALPQGSPAAGRPPLLLVHGAGHGAWCWEQWMPVLARRGWESYALSLRNHAGADAASPATLRTVDRETFLRRLKVEDYADDVAAVARHIARPLVALGHSMGGIVVQRCIAREGAGGAALSFRGMVLLASVSPGQMGPLRPAPLPVDQPYHPDAATAQARYFHSAPQAVVDSAVARIVDESPSVMNDYSLSPGIPIDPRHVRCPVLVVTAEHDGTTVAKDDRLARYYGAEHLHCPGQGHDLMYEAGGEAVLANIIAWLERHAGAMQRAE